MSGDVTPYTGLITSEHASKPNFSALVAALAQPLADATALANSMITLFDVDTGVGQQLDYIGEWVGITRNLEVAITNVFWSLDIPPGLDQGIVWNQFTPTSGVQQLPDGQYRTALRAKILNNQWNGSLSQAYAISNALFLNTGYVPFILDNGDLTIYIGLAGLIPDTLTMSMLTHGMLDVRPAGVQVIGYITPSANSPIAAFDIENAAFAGADVGSIAVYTAPS